MKYAREVRRSLTRCPTYVLDDLRDDLIKCDTSKEYWREIFVMRMWLLGKSNWRFFGGSKVVNNDKRVSNVRNWKHKMQRTYEHVTESTHRQLFGRRYAKKTPYPSSFVFYDVGKNGGLHIHTLHHFPIAVEKRWSEYINTFHQLWNIDGWNERTGRQFYFEDVRSQEGATRYALDKVKDLENGWFAVG